MQLKKNFAHLFYSKEFETFVESKFAFAALRFWRKAMKYKETSNDKERAKRGLFLYNTFISPTGEEWTQVALPGSLVQNIRTQVNLKKFPVSLFDEAVREVELQLQLLATEFRSGSKKEKTPEVRKYRKNLSKAEKSGSKTDLSAFSKQEKPRGDFNVSILSSAWLQQMTCVRSLLSFLKKKNKENLLLFYLFAEKFSGLEEQDERNEIAPKIFARFLVDNAPELVLLSKQAKADIKRSLQKSPDSSRSKIYEIIFFSFFLADLSFVFFAVFDTAKEEVIEELNKELFPQFLKSSAFNRLKSECRNEFSPPPVKKNTKQKK